MKQRIGGLMTAAAIAAICCQPLAAGAAARVDGGYTTGNNRQIVKETGDYIYEDIYRNSDTELDFNAGLSGAFNVRFSSDSPLGYRFCGGKKYKEPYRAADLFGTYKLTMTTKGPEYEGEITDAAQVEALDQIPWMSYSAEIETEGWMQCGVCCWLENPNVRLMIADGWNGENPLKGCPKIGSAVIYGETYNYYVATDAAIEPMTEYWCVREKNAYADSENGFLSCFEMPVLHLEIMKTLAPDRFDFSKTTFDEMLFFVSGGQTPVSCALLKMWHLPFPAADYTAPTGEQKQVQYPARTDNAPFRAHQNNDYSYTENGDGLKDLMGPYFRVGAYPNSMIAGNADDRSFYLKNYNSVSCGYGMQGDQLIRDIDGTDVEVDLTNADPVLKFAEENGLGMRGSALILPNSLPYGLQMYQDSPEESDLRIENLFRETFSRLKTNYPALKLYAYDVCSGMLSDEDGSLLDTKNGEQAPWAAVYGAGNDAFILNAFRAARKYAPADCKLFLTEDEEWNPAKTAGICALAKKIMKDSGSIDGIGMSGYICGVHPSSLEYESALKKYMALGLDVQITDMSVHVDSQDYTGDSAATRQAFRDFFTLAIRYSEHITSVTMHEAKFAFAFDKCPNGLFDYNGAPLASYYDVAALAGNVLPLPVSDIQLEPETTAAPVTTTANPSGTAYLAGDANCDGSVDVADAVLVLRYISEDETAGISDQGVKNGDADRNGQTDSDDASLILRFIAKKITL